MYYVPALSFYSKDTCLSHTGGLKLSCLSLLGSWDDSCVPPILSSFFKYQIWPTQRALKPVLGTRPLHWATLGPSGKHRAALKLCGSTPSTACGLCSWEAPRHSCAGQVCFGLLWFTEIVPLSFRLRPEKLEKDLDGYSSIARTRGGEKVGLEEFSAFLQVPVSDALQDAFALFDEVCGLVCVHTCEAALKAVGILSLLP